MFPLEVIVRNIAAGSVVHRYPFCEGEPLDPPVIVIDYKSDERHDPMLNDDLIYALGLATPESRQIGAMALANEVLREPSISAASPWSTSNSSSATMTVRSSSAMRSVWTRWLWDKETGASLDKDVYRFSKGDVRDLCRRRGADTRAAPGRSRVGSYTPVHPPG